MTRKHFELLAGALLSAIEGTKGRERKGVIKAIEAIATACKGMNPRFDLDRFRRASGIL